VDLWDLLKVAVRQWRVLVPLLALTFGAAVFVSGSIAPEYSASGSIVLIGPSETPGEPAQPPAEPGGVETPGVEPSPVNPYLSFNSSLAITAEVLSLRLTSAQAVGALADAGLATTYEVNLTPRSPILQLTAKGDDATTVVATLDRLIEMAGGELEQLQSTGGAPETQRAAIDVLSRSNAAAPDASGAQRVRLLVLALGVAASVAVAYATEGLLALRRTRSAKQLDHDGDEGEPRDEWDDRDLPDDRHAVPQPVGHAAPALRGERPNGRYVEDRRGMAPTGRANGGPPPARRPPVADAPVARAMRAANGPPLRTRQDEAPVTPRPTWSQR
jgi:hypothetical protein